MPAETATMPDSGPAPPPPVELVEELVEEAGAPPPPVELEELADEELEPEDELADEEFEPVEEAGAPPPPLDELPVVEPVFALPLAYDGNSVRVPHPAAHANSKSQARVRGVQRASAAAITAQATMPSAETAETPDGRPETATGTRLSGAEFSRARIGLRVSGGRLGPGLQHGSRGWGLWLDGYAGVARSAFARIVGASGRAAHPYLAALRVDLGGPLIEPHSQQ